MNYDNTAQESLKDGKTNGELIKDGGAVQESFEDIGIADEVIKSDETTRSLSMEVGLLVKYITDPQMSSLKVLSKVADMLTMLLMVKRVC